MPAPSTYVHTPDFSAVRPTVAATSRDVIVVDPGFEHRWAAWQARGRAHEAAFRRKAVMVAPALTVVGLAIYYLLTR
jgi:hypothetical protein